MLFSITNKEILKNYRVCDLHFVGLCKNPSGRLMRYALPTLNLPGMYLTMIKIIKY